MEDFDDDFGELYADVELQANSAVNFAPEITNLYIEQSNKVGNDSSNMSKNDSGKRNGVDFDDVVVNEVEVESGSGSDDSDDDFDVVVNDDDFEAKNGRESRNAGDDEENVVVTVTREGSLSLKDQDRVNGGSRVEQNGGERGYVGKNGCHSQYKFVRQHESVSLGTQRVISRGDKEDISYIQNRRTSLGRVGPSYAGTFPSLSEHGGGFWLPWNRTILDVDIGMFEQKPWTLLGADMTDYFNFGFDEESWKSYCQSLDQLRRLSFSQRKNQVNRLRLMPDNHITATEEVGAVIEKPIYNEDIMGMQIGQAIHVEDSYFERQPSMDARPPRTRDSDVVIEITMQDPKDSSSGKEELDEIRKAKQEILEDGRGIDNVEPQAEKSTGYKSQDMATDSVEENIQSRSASSELKRSYESGTGSGLMLQDSSSQGNGRKSKSDALYLGKVDTFSRGYSRAVEKLNNSTEDANTSSTDTNPCVAGIDELFDDQIQSSPTPSDSVTWSKGPEDSDHRDLRKIKDFRRSSADSVLVGPVVDYDHLASRGNGRGDIKVKDSAVKRHSRARSPTEEDRKHRYQRVRKHSVLSNHNEEDDSYHIGIRRHIYDRSPLSAHHHKSEVKLYASTFHEDRPRYREKESSLGYYDKRTVEHKSSCMREFYHRDAWGSSDEVDLCSPRGWNEDAFFSETRVKRTKGEIVERERFLHEREGIIWDREQLFQNQPHFTSRYSADIERQNLRRDFDDVRFSMRSRHELSLEYGYSDDRTLDRYARPYPLNRREEEHLDLDIEHDRRLQHIGREVGISGRKDQYSGTPPLDLDYPWDIRDEDEDWDWQASRSTRDYLDRHHAYTERRHGSTICGEDPRLFEKHRSHDRYISHRNGLDDRRLYYHIDDTHDRPDTVRYLDVDDYVVTEQNDFQSRGMSWREDKQSNRHFHNDLYGGEELDYFEDVSRHEWHETRSGFIPDGMGTHMQITNQKQQIVKGGGRNPCGTRSKMPSRFEHPKIGIWCKNAGESRHIVRERKTVQPSGKCSKSRRDPDNELHETETNDMKEIKAVNIVAINHDKLHAKNHNNVSDDLEEGQILPTQEPRKEIPKENKGDPKRMSHNQKVTNQKDLNAYDENRLLETMAKMEKRRERFKEPILQKKETDSDPKPQVDPVVQTADDESKQQRPLRKRRWQRERFKEPILPEKETDSDPNPQVDPVVQTADESKQQRPLRKRRWGGS